MALVDDGRVPEFIELRKTRKTKNLGWRNHKKGSQNVGKLKIRKYLIDQLSKHVATEENGNLATRCKKKVTEHNFGLAFEPVFRLIEALLSLANALSGPNAIKTFISCGTCNAADLAVCSALFLGIKKFVGYEVNEDRIEAMDRFKTEDKFRRVCFCVCELNLICLFSLSILCIICL